MCKRYRKENPACRSSSHSKSSQTSLCQKKGRQKCARDVGLLSGGGSVSLQKLLLTIIRGKNRVKHGMFQYEYMKNKTKIFSSTEYLLPIVLNKCTQKDRIIYPRTNKQGSFVNTLIALLTVIVLTKIEDQRKLSTLIDPEPPGGIKLTQSLEK